MAREEMTRQFRSLIQTNLPEDHIYHLIHWVGRAEILEVRQEAEGFLTDPRSELRRVALEVLTRHFRLPEHWDTARRMLQKDPNESVRAEAAWALLSLKRNSKGLASLRALAQVVSNEDEDRYVREAAYTAMPGILQDDPRERFRLRRDLDQLWREVDRELVNSYLGVSDTHGPGL